MRISLICIMFFISGLLFTPMEADWLGWVTFEDTGNPAQEAKVQAMGGPTQPETKTDEEGFYRLNSENGMWPGYYYDCVYSELDRNDTIFGGQHNGGIYLESAQTEKSIELTYPISTCNITK